MTGYERITWIYEKLKAKLYPCRADFMACFEVSESTFKRDISFLRDRLFAPINYDHERGGYYLTEQRFELPAFWFDHRQLLVIAAVCRQLEQLSHSPRMAVLRMRILDMLTLRGGRRLDIFSFENAPCVTCNNENFDLLSRAMLMERLVSIVYRDGRSGAITERQVEPYRLHNYEGGWYLIGFCRLRGEARNFQLGRILESTILDEEMGNRRLDIDEYINGAFGIFKGTELTEAVLRFRPAMKNFVHKLSWHPKQKVVEEADGSVSFTLPVTDFTEIRMKILQYGHNVEVISPPELRRQVAEEAAAMAVIYEKEKNEKKIRGGSLYEPGGVVEWGHEGK